MPDPSLFLPLLLQSALIPFGVALAVLFALRRAGVAQAAVAALAAGFVAAYFSIFHAQWSPLPRTALDSLPYIAAIGAVAAIAAENAGGALARLLSRIVVALAVAAAVVWPAMASLGWGKAVALAAGFALAAGAAWSWLAQSAASRPTPAPLLAVVAGGSALVLMLDASAALGQAAGALASALAACVLFNLPRTRAAFSSAAAGTAVLLAGALLLNAHVYAGLSAAYLALLMAGLLADPLVAAANRMRRQSGGAGSWAATLMLTAIPVMVTVGLAVRAMQESGGY